MAFSSLTVRCSGILALGIERQEEGHLTPCRQGSRCLGLSCFCTFSLLSVLFFSLLNTMFAMSWLIYTMAEDGLLFRFLARINASTRTHIRVIMILENLKVDKQNPLPLDYLPWLAYFQLFLTPSSHLVCALCLGVLALLFHFTDLMDLM